MELIFRCAKNSLLRLSLGIVSRLEFVADFAFSKVSEKKISICSVYMMQ